MRLSLVILLFLSQTLLAQRPSISYDTPKKYVTGTTIIPLRPDNTGGAVPPNIYNMVSTFAGGRAPVSYDGEGGTDAGFDNPSGVATDASGNIYISDFGSGAIRKIAPDAKVTTIGNVRTPSGLTINAQGELFVTNFEGNSIYKINPGGSPFLFAGNGSSGATDGPAGSASFSGPGGLTVDAAGNLYLADQINNKIRKITPTGDVSTIAGSGAEGSDNGPALSAKFYNPDGVAVDQQGNIYVADSKNNLIRKITPQGAVTTFAGSGAAGNADGTGTAASFNYPTSICTDAADNLYVADFRNNIIRKITPGAEVTTLAGSGNAGNLDGIGRAATFYGPLGLDTDPFGNLYVSDFINDLIRKITLTGYTIDKPLPAGLVFDPTTGIISGTPTTSSLATDYKITAHNVSGSHTTIVNIETAARSPLVFNGIPIKTECSGDFDPGATGGGGAITYTSSNPLVAEIISGRIHITGPGTSVISASDGITSAAQTLTVSELLVPEVNIDPRYLSACDGMELTFTAVAINAGNNPVYDWFVNGQRIELNSPVFKPTTLREGDEIFCKVTNTEQCRPVSSLPSPVSILVDSTPYSTISVTITSSVTGVIPSGTAVTFLATPSANVQDQPEYEWQINGMTIGFKGNPFTTPALKDGDVVSCYMASGGACVINPVVLSNEIAVSVSPEVVSSVMIPNAFSPNGDGINDLWQINGLSSCKSCSIKVFNRFGQIVYNSIGYVLPWNGKSEGKLLPAGVYYYVIINEKEKLKRSGSVSILL